MTSFDRPDQMCLLPHAQSNSQPLSHTLHHCSITLQTLMLTPIQCRSAKLLPVLPQPALSRACICPATVSSHWTHWDRGWRVSIQAVINIIRRQCRVFLRFWSNLKLRVLALEHMPCLQVDINFIVAVLLHLVSTVHANDESDDNG